MKIHFKELFVRIISVGVAIVSGPSVGIASVGEVNGGIWFGTSGFGLWCGDEHYQYRTGPYTASPEEAALRLCTAFDAVKDAGSCSIQGTYTPPELAEYVDDETFRGYCGRDPSYDPPFTWIHFHYSRVGNRDTKNAGEKCDAMVGNPINVATGNKFQVETDYMDNRDGLLSFRRYYNSRDALPGNALGAKWRHEFERRLVLSGDPSLVTMERMDGKGLFFELQNGVWVSDGDIKGQLTQITDESGVTVGWTYHDPAGITESYDSQGSLIKITKGPSEINIIYGPGGLIDTVSRNSGEAIAFDYDSFNRITSITDNTGRVWKYEYNNEFVLQSVYYPDATPSNTLDNPVRQYHYDNPNSSSLLTGITDESGLRYANYEYDTNNRAIASYQGPQTDALEKRIDSVLIDYGYGGTRTVLDSKGNQTTYNTIQQFGVSLISSVSGSGCSGCVSTGDMNISYDSDSNLAQRVENGVSTGYGDYDTKGQYGYKVEAVGTPEERRIEYDYDPRFYNKITEIREPSVYSSAQKITTRTYDDWGNRLTETINGYDPDGNTVSRTTRYEYNGPLHQLSLIDGPRTDVSDLTHYRYYPNDPAYGDDRGRLKEVEDANGVLVRRNLRYTATGKLRKEHRGALRLNYYYYPGNDRLKQLVETDTASGEQRKTRWTYLATGEVKSITQGYGTPEATTLTFDYDDARRLVRITDGLGNYIAYTLDTEGNREAENIYDNAGALKKQLIQAFDIYNQLDRTDQANESVDYDYAPDGTLDLQSDGLGTVTDYDYDALRRLTRVRQDINGTDPSTASAVTTYDYDAQSNLTQVTDPIDGTTIYAYDDLGNLTRQTSPDTGTTTFRYDAAGNRIEKTDAKGQIFTYTYDVLNRLTGIDGPGTDSDVSYVYDTCPNGQGRLCRVTRTDTSLDYSYTAFGEITQADQAVVTWSGIQTAAGSVSYLYDAAGRVSGIRYPSGVQVDYTFNASGNITAVQLHHDGITTQLLQSGVYRPFGELMSGMFGNGQQYYEWYDQAYRPLWRYSGPYNQWINPYSSYDANGNLVAYWGSESPTFSYDALDRIDTASSGYFGNRDYAYDRNGNRTRLEADSQITTYGYTPQTNRLEQLDGDSQIIDLDANGNTTTLRGMTLTYTPDNRLASVMNMADYRYNGLGQRVYRLVKVPGAIGQGPKRSYIYGLKGELLAETGPTGQVTREYIYLNGKPLAMLDHVPASDEPILNGDFDGDGVITLEDLYEWYFLHYSSPSGQDPAYDVTGDGVNDSQDMNAMMDCVNNVGSCQASAYDANLYYIHNDHLGTPKALTDENGTRVWSATHTPFGQATVNEDPDGDGRVVVFNLRFPGQYYDGETGLHYNYYRYYDPSTGRYITADPIGLNGGTNSYLYANANPLTFMDPLGLAACDGQWKRVRWVRDPFSAFSFKCTCYWSCYSCTGSGAGDAFPVPNLGQYSTKGTIFFNPGRTGKDFDPEGGNDCLCSEPGPERGCNECEDK